MTVRASSRRPGFSYVVGVIDKPSNILQNLADAWSCGGWGMIGSCRRDVEGGLDEEDVGLCMCIGEGECDRDRCWRSLNLRMRINCSNCLVRSAASKGPWGEARCWPRREESAMSTAPPKWPVATNDCQATIARLLCPASLTCLAVTGVLGKKKSEE